jgi:hypothetical protein
MPEEEIMRKVYTGSVKRLSMLICGTLLLASLVLMVSAISPAWADVGGISGTVTDASTAGIADVIVYVYDSGDNLITLGFTMSDGTYTIGEIPTGSYRVEFSGTGYLDQWYNNENSFSTSNAVAVVAPNTTPNINAVLSVGGGISGTVTDASLVGIANVTVYVYDSNDNYVASGVTASDGTYAIAGIPTGSYAVYFFPLPGSIYESQWYSNENSFCSANMVAVTAPNTTPNINAVLAAGGSISGQVTNASAVGIAGVYVDVYDGNDNFVSSGTTASDGTYTVGSIPTGSYSVYFSVYNSIYVSQWYKNESSFASANMVAVTAPNTTPNINAVLAVGGGISGQVTNASAVGIANVEVDVYDSTDNFITSGFTASDGTYTLIGIPTGSYKVNFAPYSSIYVGQWYSNQSSFASANTVAVTAPNTTPAISAMLAVGGSIYGTVTNASTAGIANVEVSVYDNNDDYIASGLTASDGTYTVSGIPTGSYKVNFSPNNSVYVSQWFNNESSFASANTVAVTAPNTTPAISAVLAVGGSISGKVTNASTAGIANVEVSVYDNNGNYIASGLTASDGTYTVSGLPTGSYKVQFTGFPCSSGQWYNNENSLSSADAVQVTAPNTTSAINAVFGGTQYTLTIIKTGNGTVTAIPNGGDADTLTWSGNTGTAAYAASTQVSISAVAGTGSTFYGWSGDYVSNVTPSQITMDSVMSITATFDDYTGPTCANPPFSVGGSMLNYPTIQDAYNALMSGEKLEILALGFTEIMNLNQSKSVGISGGFRCDYAIVSGFTTVHGTITISQGTVNIENLIIQ